MLNITSDIQTIAIKLEEIEGLMEILSDYFGEATVEPSPVALSCFYGRAAAYGCLVDGVRDLLHSQKEKLDEISVMKNIEKEECIA